MSKVANCDLERLHKTFTKYINIYKNTLQITNFDISTT